MFDRLHVAKLRTRVLQVQSAFPGLQFGGGVLGGDGSAWLVWTGGPQVEEVAEEWTKVVGARISPDRVCHHDNGVVTCSVDAPYGVLLVRK